MYVHLDDTYMSACKNWWENMILYVLCPLNKIGGLSVSASVVNSTAISRHTFSRFCLDRRVHA